MRRLIWIVAWLVVAAWSLVAWGSYGLVGLFGDVAVRNADILTGHPETVEFLSWALATLRSLGLFAVVAVWAVVSLLILGAAAVLAKVLGAGAHRTTRPDWQRTVVTRPEPPAAGVPRAGGPPSDVKDMMRRIEDRQRR
jgi:hypothetical protein